VKSPSPNRRYEIVFIRRGGKGKTEGRGERRRKAAKN
jgi:hypothetical protein